MVCTQFLVYLGFLIRAVERHVEVDPGENAASRSIVDLDAEIALCVGMPHAHQLRKRATDRSPALGAISVTLASCRRKLAVEIQLT